MATNERERVKLGESTCLVYGVRSEELVLLLYFYDMRIKESRLTY